MPQVVSTISQYRQSTVWNRSDLRLCRFLGLSEGFWLRMQSSHDHLGAYANWANRAPDGPEWKISAELIALAP
jgi:plasmid maintenance system antidote protein VapI